MTAIHRSLSTLTPRNIGYFISEGGFWYTYWMLREEEHLTRKRTLWLMWVGWNYHHHCIKHRM